MRVQARHPFFSACLSERREGFFLQCEVELSHGSHVWPGKSHVRAFDKPLCSRVDITIGHFKSQAYPMWPKGGESTDVPMPIGIQKVELNKKRCGRGNTSAGFWLLQDAEPWECRPTWRGTVGILR